VDVVATVAAKDVMGASGSSAVSGIRTRSGETACDLIVACGPRVPNAGMAAQAGARLAWRTENGAFVPTDLPANVSVVGDAAGDSMTAVDYTPESTKRSFVCFCNDVTSEDLRSGIREGFDHIETLKRYTTATMGPCQGRMCQLSAVGVCARETGRSMGDTGVTTSRPPNPGVTLGALAGPRHHPTRRTPMHASHEALGAVWMDMGDWKRPRQYEKSIEDEYRAVRERVGIIDVSTLGKLSVRGPDAGKLLDKVYTHRFSDLKPRRVRYALMCDESGVILDDGTVSRLDEGHYFITTTTGNLDFVHQWFEWYLIGTGWDVRITNVTAGYGSMNLAGPRARDLLSKLTSEDLSAAAFPYMACRDATVCGVPSVLLRIGFVGETGWEIHTPAEFAEGVWNRLLEAGREFGIDPFGVEAQRLLRLEKRHVIIGVDTDALASPYEAGLSWAAKLDKPDFVGKVALTKAAKASAPEKLVGFEVMGGGVPDDGSAVVLDGRIAGRVTSCRYSPYRKAAIGLAWVPAAKAEEGASIQVRVNGALADAKVTLQAFYDPDGARLRQ
jgi:sarcosine oxidase subunit alpha